MPRSLSILLVTALASVSTVRAEDPPRVPPSEWKVARSYEAGTREVRFTLPAGLVERVLVDQELRGAAPAPHLRIWCQSFHVAVLLSTQEALVDGQACVRAAPGHAFVDGVMSVEGMFSIELGRQALRFVDDGWRLDVAVQLEVGGTAYPVALELVLRLPRGAHALVRSAEATWRGPAPERREAAAAATSAEETHVRLEFEPRAAELDRDARGLEQELRRLVAWCRERPARELVIETHADRVAWSNLDAEAWRAPDRAEAERLALARAETLRAGLEAELGQAARVRVELRGWDDPYAGRPEAHLVLRAQAAD